MGFLFFFLIQEQIENFARAAPPGNRPAYSSITKEMRKIVLLFVSYISLIFFNGLQHLFGNKISLFCGRPPSSGAPFLLYACFCFLQIFVLCKTWKTVPSRRHLFLGQMLLSGLFVCSAVSLALMTEPTTITCAIVRFGIGFGYCLIFSTLLVKCVFLISLNGGVYLPAPYQALLLFFAVAIQIAINVQWLINTPPNLIQVIKSEKPSRFINYH